MGLSRVCGLLTTGFGFVAILGWIAGIPPLTTFGSGRIPMAPSTALLFLWFGVELFVFSRPPLNRAVQRIGMAVGSLGALAALSLFFLSLLGIHLKVEHLGIPISGTVNGAPIGHMSPLTAFCFVIASVSLSAFLSSSGRRWQEAVAFGSASLLVLTSVALLLAYLFGTPLLYGSGFIPPALPTSMAFLFLGTGLAVSSGKRIWPRGTQSETAGKRAAAVLILIFFLSAIGIVAAGYIRFRNFQGHFRAEAKRTLSAIAELKVRELVQWRKERMADAAFFFTNDNFTGLVDRFLENPQDKALEGRLRVWLGKVQAAHLYDRVFLLDAQGVERISAPDTAETAEPHIARDAPEILRSGKVDFLDFHRDSQQGPIRLSVLVPILGGPDNGRALGILGLRIDPETYLYPLLKRWPTPSRTAETLLVRREGNDALFLNQLKFQADTALTLRSPLTNTDMPAVMAVLGQEGIVEGIDYRGVPVVAALLRVPDSPWFIVARMDMAEVYAPLQERLWQMIAFVLTLLLGAGAGVGMVWRHQRARFYRERYEAERERFIAITARKRAEEALHESEERYRTTLMSIGDAVIATDTEGRVSVINPVAEALTGWSRAEAANRPLDEVFHIVNEETRQRVESPVRKVLREGIVVGLANHTLLVARDGTESPIADSGAPIRTVAGKLTGVVLVFRDQSEERAAQTALRESEERYRILNAELEERVTERTAQLDASNKELEAFAYSVSHDLRAPLRAIDGFSRIVLEDYGDKLDAEGNRLLNVVRSNTQQMDRLITDLLAMSRATRTEMRLSRIDMTAMARSIYHEAASPEDRERFELSVASLPEALGDPALLRQVWHNLLANAIKYTLPKEVRRIAVGGYTEKAMNIYFVKDSGVGFNPDYSHKLFGVFQRLHKTEEFEGTGIGLAIVQRIVHRHGGKVWAEGKIDEGATFYFSLPEKENDHEQPR